MLATNSPLGEVLEDLAVDVDVIADGDATVIAPRHFQNLDRVAAAVAAPGRLVTTLRLTRWAQLTTHGWVVYVQQLTA